MTLNEIQTFEYTVHKDIGNHIKCFVPIMKMTVAI